MERKKLKGEKFCSVDNLYQILSESSKFTECITTYYSLLSSVWLNSVKALVI